jgi:hypothetical protein
MLLFQGKNGFKAYRPLGQWVEPPNLRRRENTQKLIALFRDEREDRRCHRAAVGALECGLRDFTRGALASRRWRSFASFALAPSASRRANSSQSRFIFAV